MAILDTEIKMTFRGQEFNNTVYTDYVMLYDIPEGMSSPGIRSNNTEKQGQHGMSDYLSYYNGRNITLTGKIVAQTIAGRKVLEDNIRRIFSLPGIQSASNSGYYTLYIDESGEIDTPAVGEGLKQIDVKVSVGVEFSKISGEGNMRDFIVTLFAKDPTYKSQTLNVENIIEAYEGTSFQLETLLPVTISAQTYNIGTITNSGNFAVPALYNIQGEAVNPKLENTTTGRFMQINETVTAGDELIIDVELGTIELNGTDVSASMTNDSQWIFLEPGNNSFELTDDTPVSLEATCDVTWRDGWI